jgi:AcrR family transcriptional regulator
MDAAVDCLAETGYAHTTTTTVAVRAGLTRAAMLYHFPSRMALIEAVIHYVTRERVRMFHEAYVAMPEGSRTDGRHIDIYWAQVQHRIFKAFGELSAAARADLDLAAVFIPASAEFDRARRESALQLFPQEFTQQPYFDLRRDVTRYMLEGLAQLDSPAYNAERRVADMLGFLKALTSEPEGRILLLKALERSSSRRHK